MKKISIILIILVITACSKEDNSITNFDGKYVGTFERDGRISNVELNFSNNEFSGESDQRNFPAIYYGEFSIDNQSLNFDNKQEIITTEFDPDLILDGYWSYEIQKYKLTLTNSIGDIYILNKQ